MSNPCRCRAEHVQGDGLGSCEWSVDDSACIAPALQKELAEAKAQLKEYSGWSPHQFLGLLEEHRELGRKYVKLDSRRYALEVEVVTLMQEQAAIRQGISISESPTGEDTGLVDLVAVFIEHHKEKEQENAELRARISEFVEDERGTLEARMDHLAQWVEKEFKHNPLSARGFEGTLIKGVAELRAEVERLKFLSENILVALRESDACTNAFHDHGNYGFHLRESFEHLTAEIERMKR